MINLEKIYKGNKLLALYKCGSNAFRTTNANSDNDYVAVMDGFHGFRHYEDDNDEFFIFSKDFFEDKMDFNSDLTDYYKIFNDEVLAFPDTIIYLDESYKEEFFKITNIDFKSKCKSWIRCIVNYFDFYLVRGTITKTMHHIIRVAYLIKNFKKSDSFSLSLSTDILEIINDYKINKNYEKYRDRIIEDFEYLKKELNENE